MIAKVFRLTESDVGKVLKKKKPFFSYTLVANVAKNQLAHGRFGIILSGKVTKTSIDRNFYRRAFYELARQYIDKGPYDVVIVAKKGTVLSRKDEESRQNFEKEIIFLLKKVFSQPSHERPTAQHTPPHVRIPPRG
jgi:ribonuclease P protein component